MDKNSYSSIIKATSLFGGVKLFQILITVIRSKIIAVLLGPAGVGVMSLITSTTDIIAALTGFGLRTSAVRDISQAYSNGDELQQNRILTVLRKLVVFTGLLGGVLCFAFAPGISHIVFGDDTYVLSFRIVSIIFLFNQINIGQIVLLQGTFRYKDLAKSTLFSNVSALVISLPLYYVYGLKGIVPAIILSSLMQLLFSWLYSSRIPYRSIRLSLSQVFNEGRTMLTLGFVIALTGFITQGSSYLVRLFISKHGDIVDVGLYSAGIAIANNYISIILTSMSTDYAPRLSAIAHNNKEFIEVINKQMMFIVILVSPLISIFILLVNEVILLLYSARFSPINDMVELIMLGMIFRCISWALSFAYVARGDSRLFFWNELVTSTYSLIFLVTGYYLYGLTGVGIGFLLTYLVYSVQVLILSKYRFSYRLDIRKARQLVLLVGLLAMNYFSLRILKDDLTRYLAGGLFFIAISSISLVHLNQMVNLKLIAARFIKRLK
jgi:O-antigen/teichoic acid export membrane protein